MRRKIAVVFGIFLGLAACSEKSPTLFDGKQYKTRVDAPRDDRSSFSVAVRDGASNLDAAQRAGRYAGTTYCFDTFGSSKILWASSGTVAADQLVAEPDGSLQLQGRCVYR